MLGLSPGRRTNPNRECLSVDCPRSGRIGVIGISFNSTFVCGLRWTILFGGLIAGLSSCNKGEDTDALLGQVHQDSSSVNASADKPSEPQILWRRSEATAGLMSELGLPPADGALAFLQTTGAPAENIDGYDAYFSLLSGILYSWGADHPAIAAIGGPASEEHQIKVLERLGQGFGFETIEMLTLDAASVVRRDFGSECSVRVLENGLEIDPTSSIIRSDLIADAALLSYRSGPNPDLAELILGSFKEIDLHVLDDEPRQIILAAVISAKVLLERDAQEIRRNIDEFVPMISNNQLRTEMLKFSGDLDGYRNPFDWLRLFDL